MSNQMKNKKLIMEGILFAILLLGAIFTQVPAIGVFILLVIQLMHKKSYFVFVAILANYIILFTLIPEYPAVIYAGVFGITVSSILGRIIFYVTTKKLIAAFQLLILSAIILSLGTAFHINLHPTDEFQWVSLVVGGLALLIISLPSKFWTAKRLEKAGNSLFD